MDLQVEQLHVEIMKEEIVNKDVHLHQIHVIAKLLQLQNVEMDQLLFILHVEITKMHHVNKDVIHNLLIHVIAKQLQLDNVEMDQPVEQLDVEIMLLEIVQEDVHLNYLLNHQEQLMYLQILVIVLLLQLDNVEMDLPVEQLHVEIELVQIVKEDVQNLNQLNQEHVIADK
jgi:hypothetical protein